MDKKEIIAFFDDMAHDWDANQKRNEKVIDFILSAGGVAEGKHILDVACGTGILFSDYLACKAKVTGIDISSAMCETAKKKFPQAEVVCADAEECEFHDIYDVVMIYNAFPHFTNPKKLFENLWSALAEKGRLTVAHGMSEKELEKCHSGVAKKISFPLPSKEKLAEMMSEFFDVDVMLSDEEKYVVSGMKKQKSYLSEKSQKNS